MRETKISLKKTMKFLMKYTSQPPPVRTIFFGKNKNKNPSNGIP
jgi:hypothetical protein